MNCGAITLRPEAGGSGMVGFGQQMELIREYEFNGLNKTHFFTLGCV
jgi:hypothetical protein